jgi:hypothetical protein
MAAWKIQLAIEPCSGFGRGRAHFRSHFGASYQKWFNTTSTQTMLSLSRIEPAAIASERIIAASAKSQMPHSTVSPCPIAAMQESHCGQRLLLIPKYIGIDEN